MAWIVSETVLTMHSVLNELRRQIITATPVMRQGRIASALSVPDSRWVAPRGQRFAPKNPKSDQPHRRMGATLTAKASFSNA